MNWGDIVDESERIEPAVSKQGETLYVTGTTTTARLSSDIDRYRVPSQDWGVPCFFPVNPSSKLLPAKAVTVGMEIRSNCRKQGKRKEDAREMKVSNANKVISVLLSVAMCPMMVPSAAFAADDDAASGASSPSEQTQSAGQAEGVDAGASSSDTITPQSEATGEAAGDAAPVAEANGEGAEAAPSEEGAEAVVAEVNGKT